MKKVLEKSKKAQLRECLMIYLEQGYKLNHGSKCTEMQRMKHYFYRKMKK